MKHLSIRLAALALMVVMPVTTPYAQHQVNPAIPQLPRETFESSNPDLRSGVELMNEQEWGQAVRAFSDHLDKHPDDLESLYFRAIARRERAAQRTLRAKVTDQWQRGIEDFDSVIKRDSSFRDALYQYALFSRVQKRLTDLRGLDQNITYRDAIRLGHAQVRLRPAADEHLYHLFEFYRRYIHHTETEEALSWLRNRPSDYAAYFAGEVLRLAGRQQQADEAFAGLPMTPGELPEQAVLLSRAKVYYALDRPARAQEYIRQAIRGIDRPVDAAFVLEDFKYVLDEQELATYRDLRNAEQYRAFFNRIWTKRDPMPARQMNIRLAEHYDRLLTAEQEYWYDGLRLWRNNPDEMNTLEFPSVYTLNQEFNDKGLVYIRHGEPDDQIVTVEGEINTFRTGPGVLPKDQSYRASWVPNESWRYTYAPMDFHFVIGEGATGNNWRLVPTVTNFNMLEDREMWGGSYRQMARAAREAMSRNGSNLMDASNSSSGGRGSSDSFSALTDFTQARDDLQADSREAVARGLASDRHTWSSDVTSMEIPHTIAAFRGADGSTDIQIHYAVPENPINERLDDGADGVRIEAGFIFQDSTWQTVASDLSTHEVTPDGPREGSYMFETSVPPDSYHVAIHGRLLETTVLGGYKFDAYVPDLTGNETTMSDLLLAHSISPAPDSASATRGSVDIRVNPHREFSVEEPLFVYFEIYRLTLDDSDQTDYTLEYTLTPREREKGFFGRLFGGSSDAAISLENTQAGGRPSPVEYTEIDIGEVDPGDYTFSVTVTDNHTGTTVNRSQDVTISTD